MDAVEEKRRLRKLAALIETLPQSSARESGEICVSAGCRSEIIAMAICLNLDKPVAIALHREGRVEARATGLQEYRWYLLDECREDPIGAIRRRRAISWQQELPEVIRLAKERYGTLAAYADLKRRFSPKRRLSIRKDNTSPAGP